MILETQRLYLRRWKSEDAPILYQLAKNPNVSDPCGFLSHTSVENSREIIEKYLSHAYAIVLKETNQPIGCIELMIENGNIPKSDHEAELGFWLGEDYWNHGYMMEAARVLLEEAFENMKLHKVWCGYYLGNEKSKRIQEKIGFTYAYTNKQVKVQVFNETRTEIVQVITKERWKEIR